MGGSDLINKYSTNLKKVVHISGLLGAGIIFASSFINDHFVTAFQEDVQNMDAVKNDEEAAENASSTGKEQLKAAERMANLEIEMASLSKESPTEKVKTILDAASNYLNVLDSSVDMLENSVESLSDISKRVILSEDVKKEIETYNAKIKTVNETLKQETETFKELNEDFKRVTGGEKTSKLEDKATKSDKSINKLASFSEENLAQNAEEAGEAGETGADNDAADKDTQPENADKSAENASSQNPDEIFKEAQAQLDKLEALENEYKEVGENINTLFGKIDEQVSKEKEKSQSVSDTVSYLAYILSSIGAAIAGFGKWLEGKMLGVTGDGLTEE